MSIQYLIKSSVLIKIQPDATVCRYLFTAKSLYMFRVSQHPSSGVLKIVTATSGTGYNIGTATSLQRGQIGTIWPRWRPILWPVPEVAVTVFSNPGDVCRVPPVQVTISTFSVAWSGLIRPRRREVAVPVLWHVPEVTVTIFSTPDDGCCDTRNM